MLGTRPRPAPPLTQPRVRFRRTRRVYRSRGFGVFSALLLALIAAAAVWVVVTGDDPAGTPAAEAPASSPPATVPGEGGCPGFPVEYESVLDGPPASTWAAPNALAAAAPSAPAVGPAQDSSGTARCYARTPTGALFAGAGFLAAVSDPAGVYVAVQDLTVPNRGQDVLLQQVVADPAAVLGAAGGGYQIAGFRPLSVSSDTAAIAVVLRPDAGGLVAVPLTLTWGKGSWLVRLPDDGNLAELSTPLSTLDGFVPWRAG